MRRAPASRGCAAEKTLHSFAKWHIHDVATITSQYGPRQSHSVAAPLRIGAPPARRAIAEIAEEIRVFRARRSTTLPKLAGYAVHPARCSCLASAYPPYRANTGTL